MGVNLQTFPGAPDGMARAVGQHEIADTACWTLIDAFLNQPGFVTRRAGLGDGIASIASAYSLGLLGTTAPDNTWVGLHFIRDVSGAAAGEIHGFKNSSMVYDWPFAPAVAPHAIFDSKDALKGGVVVGAASSLGPSPTSQAVALYRGASKGTTTAKSLATDINDGDLTITLTAGGSDFSPGHFVFDDNDHLIGVVRSISGDVLTLEHKALLSETAGVATVYGTPFRGVNPRVSVGRITTSTDSTTMNGGLTKFKAQGLDSGTWDFYTPEFTYIGTVLSVTSDSQLELAVNAAVSLLNSDYIAIQRDGGYSLTAGDVGPLNAQHSGHQFYAKGNVLAFSDDDDPEALDLTPAGNTIVLSDDNLSALLPAKVGLVACSEQEAFVLTGATGTTPDRWGADRIHDDGCISPMTGAIYEGGAIWAGRRGVWFWQGANPINIVGALGDVYGRIVSNLSANTTLWGMVANDHYFLHIEGTDNTEVLAVDAADADGEGSALSRMTIVVNLKTAAISILRNVGIRGAVKPPNHIGAGETYFSMTTELTGTHTARVHQASSLFQENSAVGADSHISKGEALGPQFFLETKKYDVGNPQILKTFKMLLLHFKLWGTVNTQTDVDNGVADHLRFATVKGLDSSGAAVSLSGKKLFLKPVVGGWQDKRVKFMKRSQHFAIRMFQGTTTITALQLGAWAIGFKQKRPGRV